MKLRALVAEDNPINQKVALGLLKGLGLDADIAANGRQAVEMWAVAPYDLIFMDCQMPEMDGYAATAEIRRRESPGTHLPIVAITADAMEGNPERCRAAGMDAYISKPVRVEALSAVLRQWVPHASSVLSPVSH
jgi:two-component system, sensor histidine kinase and response regulator